MSSLGLGVDISSIIDLRSQQSRISFYGSAYVETHAMPDVMTALGYLGAQEPFRDNIHIMCRTRPMAHQQALRWMDIRHFHVKTGIPASRVHLCPTHRIRQAVCRTFRLTHFVGSRYETLSFLPEIVPNLILLNHEDSQRPDEMQAYPAMRFARRWGDVVKYTSNTF